MFSSLSDRKRSRCRIRALMHFEIFLFALNISWLSGLLGTGCGHRYMQYLGYCMLKYFKQIPQVNARRLYGDTRWKWTVSPCFDLPNAFWCRWCDLDKSISYYHQYVHQGYHVLVYYVKEKRQKEEKVPPSRLQLVDDPQNLASPSLTQAAPPFPLCTFPPNTPPSPTHLPPPSWSSYLLLRIS
jgi:hypothetical protein